MMIVETYQVGYYFPVLLISGLVTGLLFGILVADKRNASFPPYVYKTMTITRFASPSFIPGIPKEIGIKVVVSVQGSKESELDGIVN